MTPLNLLDAFDRGTGRFALVATYEFDPIFFERRLFRTKGFGSADRILVLMDRGRYQELVNQGITASGFNRRYLVVPVSSSGVFHPKLYLILGKQRVTGVVGSSNCTNAGIAYNMELCSTFSIQPEDPDFQNSVAMPVLRQIYEAFRSFSSRATIPAETLERHFFRPIEEEYSWLHRSVVGLDQRAEVELFHSHDGPLWSEIERRLAPLEVLKITVLSPFFDRDIALLKRIRERWQGAEFTVVAQPKYSNLPAHELVDLFSDGGTGRLIAATPAPGRRLHAKALAFETTAGTFWLAGSANATLAALDGRNTEASLWFSTEEQSGAIFESDSLTIRELNPIDFVPGTDEEPKNLEVKVVADDLSLSSVTLHEDGAIALSFDVAQSVEHVTLRIRNFNEELPVLSLPIHNLQGGKERITLDENQVGQIRGAAICELKGRGEGKDKHSNAVVLVQLNHLLRDRKSGGYGRNPLKNISETGEDLVPHLDSFGSVRDAIEFLNHCSIKFDDGETRSGGFGPPTWKPRDPFKGDTPTHWLSIPIENGSENLRNAIWDFVERHQKEKLEKHVRRGNLNGLPNFLNIFRTLNALLLVFNSRQLESNVPVIPHPFVTTGLQRNLALLIGPLGSDENTGLGFVSSVQSNLGHDEEIVRERLQSERVPQMVRAAVEALIGVRKAALKKSDDDHWSLARLRWISEWIDQNGLEPPSAEDVEIAGQEYVSIAIAA
jgi:HKD family nuclease